jgi:hypothetical protein
MIARPAMAALIVARAVAMIARPAMAALIVARAVAMIARPAATMARPAMAAMIAGQNHLSKNTTLLLNLLQFQALPLPSSLSSLQISRSTKECQL